MSAAALDGVTVDVATGTGRRAPVVRVLHDVDLSLAPAAVTALVGESGCGKSMVASALVGLLPPGSAMSGTVRIGGLEPGRDDARWRRLRGRTVGLVPQSPATAFTPVRTLGSQLDETVRVLGGPRTPGELCDLAGLGRTALGRYPHELSGGMAQRAALAAALAGAPDILVADEPTSALDPDLADHVWSLLSGVADSGVAVLVITHDLAALRRAGACASIAVMRAGHILRQSRAGDFAPDGAARDDAWVAEFFREEW